MRILFYNHTGQLSGAERVMLMTLEGLDRHSFDSVVVCPSAGPLEKAVTAIGVKAVTLDSLQARFTLRPDLLVRYFASFFRVVRELRRNVIKFSPDLIHANSIRAGLVATTATMDLGTPVVWHLHDLLPRHPISTGIRIIASLSRRTRMIGVSQAVATNFLGWFAPLLKNRVSVILNGVELRKFERNDANAAVIRNGLGLNGAHPVLGIVGQLTPRKGQLELVQAFAEVIAQLPQAVLLIAGAPIFNRDHEYAERLEREAAALGIADRVLMLGPRSDVAAIMQSLDILVVNSSAEPFGLVALEAMAVGTPVLATAVGGMPEMIDPGRTGWLVPFGNKELLVQTIVNFYHQPKLRAAVAAEARRLVEAEFSVERFVAEFESFYRFGAPLRTETREWVEPRTKAKFA